MNPLYTLIPVTMCISFAVMLPVGNPPNAIVYSYGHCQIKDMVSGGCLCLPTCLGREERLPSHLLELYT